jgi:hypothetical protein
MTCPSCGKPFTPNLKNTRTCGETACAKAWRERLRYHDEGVRHRHKQSKARRVVANPGNYTHKRVANAEMVLAQEPPRGKNDQ